MYYVYLLRINRPQRKNYLGSTGDLKERMTSHKKGFVKSTKPYLPIRLKYYEAFDNKYLALKREKSLKSSGSAYYGLMKRIGLKKV